MGVDLRQVVAGILTLTMFVMLGNMIKRDHFDSVEVSLLTPFTHSQCRHSPLCSIPVHYLHSPP